jgi:hypothetical protein
MQPRTLNLNDLGSSTTAVAFSATPDASRRAQYLSRVFSTLWIVMSPMVGTPVTL